MGKHLHELFGWPGPLTHRQFVIWQAWLDEEMNKPSRHDHYLMQIAAEVRRVLSKKPSDIKLEDFQLKFTRKGDEGLTKEQMAEASKAVWLARLGLNEKGERRKSKEIVDTTAPMPSKKRRK